MATSKPSRSQSSQPFLWIRPHPNADGCRPAGEWLRTVGTVACTECGDIRRDVGAFDVQLAEGPEKSTLMSWVGTWPSLKLIHSAVINCLDRGALHSSLWLGTVYDEAGKAIPEWHTVHAREVVLCRATNVTTYRYCNSCAGLLYQAHGRRCALCPAPSEKVIYQNELGHLVLHETLVSDEIYKYRRKLGINRIGVTDKPPDGLAQHLELWGTPSKQEERRKARELWDALDRRVVEDLKAVGVIVSSTTHLKDLYRRLPKAVVEVLLRYIPSGDPRYSSWLVQCLWSASEPFDGRPLAKLYESTDDRDIRWCIALAIALGQTHSIDEWIEKMPATSLLKTHLTDLGYYDRKRVAKKKSSRRKRS